MNGWSSSSSSVKHKHPTRTATRGSNKITMALLFVSMPFPSNYSKTNIKFIRDREGWLGCAISNGETMGEGIRIVPFGGLSFSSFHKKSAQSRRKSTNPKIIPTSN